MLGKLGLRGSIGEARPFSWVSIGVEIGDGSYLGLFATRSESQFGSYSESAVGGLVSELLVIPLLSTFDSFLMMGKYGERLDGRNGSSKCGGWGEDVELG
jgi:hypothetical protein